MQKIHSLYYHNPSPLGFEKMIIHYQKKGYRFISVKELYEILKEEKEVREKLAFISLDDGWQGNLHLIPIIERHNVPICIFVATEPLQSGNYWWEYVKAEMGVKQMLEFKKLPYFEFYKQLEAIKQRNPMERSAMTCDELLGLSRHPLVSIQSHTVNHPILTHSPNEVLDMELNGSKEWLEKTIGKEIFAFSYPNGSLTSREVEVCRRYYKMAFTTEQNHISVDNDIFLLPRYALTGQYHRDLLKVCGFWKVLKRALLLIKN